MTDLTYDLLDELVDVDTIRLRDVAWAEIARLRADRDHWQGLANEQPEPCRLDHSCDPDEICSCWCPLHDCAIGECETFKTVEAWLVGMREQHEKIVERLRQELDEARAERDRMRPVVEAAEAWVDAPFASNDMPKLTGDLVDAVEAFRSSTPDAEPAPGVPVDTEEGAPR